MSILFFFFLLIIVFGIFFLATVLGIARRILGFGRRKENPFGQDGQRHNDPRPNAKKPKEKVFEKNEGEYVDFEDLDS